MEARYGDLIGLRGALDFHLIESAALANNALGDPSRRPLIVYTPPGYDPAGSQRYPVFYCLHGYTGDALSGVLARPWESNVVQWLDRLIVEKRVPAALLVLIDGFTRLGGSQFMNSVHNGDYATYVIHDAVGYVDERYRTIARDGGRAVLGKSSGGYGAMHLAMEYPGTFCGFASHSGDSYFAYAATPGFAGTQRVLEANGYSIEAVVEGFEKKPKRPQHEYVAMEIFGYSAAYSPRSGRAFDIDLPFDIYTGELRDDVFSRWLAFDPVHRVLERDAALRSLRLRYLDCGRRDEYALDIGARLVTRRMRQMGLEVRHEEFDDDHRSVGYRYEVSLTALGAVLDRNE